MDQKELDSLLQVMENPVRRKIIKKLSQQPGYALQLSKELGLGQPLVAKHLTLMENVGLVTSTMEESPAGPKRKRYSLARSISITMDLAPNLFLERGMVFEEAPKGRTPHTPEQLRKRFDSAMAARDDRRTLSLLSEVLNALDGRMEEIEGGRAEILSMRNRAMQEAARIVAKLEGLDKRRVLFYILDSHDRRIDSISESLNLREYAVRAILEELEKDYF